MYSLVVTWHLHKILWRYVISYRSGYYSVVMIDYKFRGTFLQLFSFLQLFLVGPTSLPGPRMLN